MFIKLFIPSFVQVLKNMMKLKSRKDESEERDEPIVSEDELDHEVRTSWWAGTN